jgi:hypothetical protein
MRGPKRGSGPRSGLYSEEKFTNWTPFDPFAAEARRASTDRRPDASLELGPDRIVRIFEAPLQPGFVRPFSAADVRQTLSEVPSENLEGLTSVLLLGGTAKQRRSRRLCYGRYSGGCIYLHPLADSFLVQRWDRPPKPSVVREYTRFGASFKRESGEWTLSFTPQSLRLFYLYDVLLHEVGHHTERNLRVGPSPASERYATWFAQYQSLKLLRGSE